MNDAPSEKSETARPKSLVMQRTIGGILWVIVIVAVLVMATTSSKPAPQEIVVPPQETAQEDSSVEEAPPRKVAPFTLTERSGREVSNEDLLEQPWVVNFIFTKCVASCPVNTKAMMELANRCKETNVKFVTITVDPERDTPEQLAGYAEIYGADPDQWWFLTGDKEKIHNLIRESFLQKVDEKEGENRILGYEFAHTDSVMHIDPTGTIIGQYLATDEAEMRTLARVLQGELETPPEHRFLEPVDLSAPVIQKVAEEEAAEDLKPAVPEWLEKLPAINATLNGLATVLLILGFILIKQGKRTPHKITMLSAFVVSGLFLACYLTYHYGLQHYTGETSKKFPDLGFIRQVYLTILFSHILLALSVPFLTGVSIYLGLTGKDASHRFWAQITFPIWLYVSVTGVIIYLMLYQLV